MWAAIEAGDWRRAYDECLDSEYGRRFATRTTKNARILLEDKIR
jgi:hypothetical protein